MAFIEMIILSLCLHTMMMGLKLKPPNNGGACVTMQDTMGTQKMMERGEVAAGEHR